MVKSLMQWSAPPHFYRLSGRFLPWLRGLTLVLLTMGLISGLAIAPADYQQGDAFRIIYLHVPSAFMSLGLYSFAATMAIGILIWRVKLAEVLLEVSLPLGASMTALALITGSIWGKPMWGTWWIWDARLTSELILLFLYLGAIALAQAIPASAQRGRILALMVLIGFIDIPVIHYSVAWWNTLHQGASLSLLKKPSIQGAMLYPLLIMIVAFGCFAAWQVLQRARSQLLQREKRAQWVKQVLTEVNA